LYGWDDGWHGKSFKFWMKKFISENSLISLKELCDDFKFKKDFDDNITYPESAAFVRFLINKFGIKIFKEVYKKIGWKKPIKETVKIFEKSLQLNFETLEKEFIDYYKKSNAA